MSYQYLLDKKVYSPKGVKKLFGKTVKEEKDEIEKVLTLGKYQKLREMWYVIFFVLAIKNKYSEEYYICPSDYPDTHLIKNIGPNQEGFPVEVMTIYDFYQKEFNGNYDELIEKICFKKQKRDYGRSTLLLINRIQSKRFNITHFARLLNQKRLPFERIWLGLFREFNKDWTFFDIYPLSNFKNITQINYNFKDAERLFF